MISFQFKSFAELSNTELYHILQLRIEVFVVEQNCPYQECDDKDFLSMHVLGYKHDKLVAYCRLIPPDISYINYCSIGRVLTKNSHRNMNIGKELMNYAINFCLNNYMHSIKISAQAYLENFYTELGFETISEQYLEDNIPHIAMLYQKENKT